MAVSYTHLDVYKRQVGGTFNLNSVDFQFDSIHSRLLLYRLLLLDSVKAAFFNAGAAFDALVCIDNMSFLNLAGDSIDGADTAAGSAAFALLGINNVTVSYTHLMANL